MNAISLRSVTPLGKKKMHFNIRKPYGILLMLVRNLFPTWWARELSPFLVNGRPSLRVGGREVKQKGCWLWKQQWLSDVKLGQILLKLQPGHPESRFGQILAGKRRLIDSFNLYLSWRWIDWEYRPSGHERLAKAFVEEASLVLKMARIERATDRWNI